MVKQLTKSNVITLTTFILALFCVFYIRDANLATPSPRILNTYNYQPSLHERILTTAKSTIGNYKIKDQDTVNSKCPSKSLFSSYSDKLDKASQDKLDKLFSMGRDNIKKYLKYSDTKYLQDYGVANIPTYGVSIVFLVFSLFSFLWLFIWLVCCSCCGKDKKKNKFGKEVTNTDGCCLGMCCRKFSCWMVFIIPVLLGVALGFWAIWFSMSINDFDG